jgi:hypothetical protein
MTEPKKRPGLGAAIGAHYVAQQAAAEAKRKKTQTGEQGNVTELRVGLAQGAAEGGDDAA